MFASSRMTAHSSRSRKRSASSPERGFDDALLELGQHVRQREAIVRLVVDDEDRCPGLGCDSSSLAAGVTRARSQTRSSDSS